MRNSMRETMKRGRRSAGKLAVAGLTALLLAGCAGQEKPETAAQTEMAAIEEAEPVAQESAASTEGETEAAGNEGKEMQGGYTDNFEVSSADAAAFGKQVKEAVAARDLEKLADLTAFPVYVGLPDVGEGVETREDFLALGAEQVFTEELLSAVAAADENALTPSKAGFVLSGAEGTANVIFGVRDGKLAVSGINY